jgi:hypothetical protein
MYYTGRTNRGNDPRATNNDIKGRDYDERNKEGVQKRYLRGAKSEHIIFGGEESTQ